MVSLVYSDRLLTVVLFLKTLSRFLLKKDLATRVFARNVLVILGMLAVVFLVSRKLVVKGV